MWKKWRIAKMFSRYNPPFAISVFRISAFIFLFPRVENADVAMLEVTDIPGSNGEPVTTGSGGD